MSDTASVYKTIFRDANRWEEVCQACAGKELPSSLLAQVIRKETHQRALISEVKRQLFTGRVKETVCGNTYTSEVSIIDLSEPDDICQSTLKIKVGDIQFEFATESPEVSVRMILSEIMWDL